MEVLPISFKSQSIILYFSELALQTSSHLIEKIINIISFCSMFVGANKQTVYFCSLFLLFTIRIYYEIQYEIQI